MEKEQIWMLATGIKDALNQSSDNAEKLKELKDGKLILETLVTEIVGDESHPLARFNSIEGIAHLHSILIKYYDDSTFPLNDFLDLRK